MTPEVLKRERGKMRLTQEELARRLGVSLNTVARWESGKHGIPAYLNMALGWLDQELLADPEWQAEFNRRFMKEQDERLKEAGERADPVAERWFGKH